MLKENKASLILFDGDRTTGLSNLKVGKTCTYLQDPLVLYLPLR